MQTPEDTALLLALMMKRSNSTRARVSEKVVRQLARRRNLRSAFREALREALDDLGVGIVELDRGGFGVFKMSALDGAKPLVPVFSINDELQRVREGKPLNIAKLRLELVLDEESDEDED